MSFDYYLVVSKESWPTFDQLQAAFVADENAINVVIPEGLNGTSPFSIDPERSEFSFLYNATECHLGGFLSTFDKADFEPVEDAWQPEYGHEVITCFKEADIQIAPEDVLVHVTHWKSDLDFGVWFLVCASFVRNFRGHFYDPQSGEIIDESGLIGIGTGACRQAMPDTSKHIAENGEGQHFPFIQKIQKMLGLR